MASKSVLALDVGEKRIGVAVADTSVKIAIAFDTIEVDGGEIDAITRLLATERAEIVVIGYPRNQSGEATAQTAYVEGFAKRLEGLVSQIIFQDESLTSVLAEERLRARKAGFSKGDIDAEAAAIILQDYLEQNYAV